MEQKIDVSVITATLNSCATLKETLDSVASQTAITLEHIIVDGGSTDGTLELCAPYSEVRILQEEKSGIYVAFNQGILAARGKIVAILNSDDVFFDSESLKKVVHEFEKQDCEVVFGKIVIHSSKSNARVLRSWDPGKYKSGSFALGWHPPHPAFFVRRSTYQSCGLFREDLPIAADFELMLRFVEVMGVNARYLNQFLVRMRGGGASQTLVGIVQGALSIKRGFELHGIRFNALRYFGARYLKKTLQILRGAMKHESN